MKIHQIAGVIGALSATFCQAGITPVNPNGDAKFEAFMDASSNLMWTNGNAFTPANFDAATTNIGNSTIEGFTDWRMPTMAEFGKLYLAQGASDTSMPRPPFTTNANFYWTTDIFTTGNPPQYVAFDPNHAIDNQNAHYFSSTTVGTWAVRAVPEPTSVALMFAGIGLFGLGSAVHGSKGKRAA